MLKFQFRVSVDILMVNQFWYFNGESTLRFQWGINVNISTMNQCWYLNGKSTLIFQWYFCFFFKFLHFFSFCFQIFSNFQESSAPHGSFFWIDLSQQADGTTWQYGDGGADIHALWLTNLLAGNGPCALIRNGYYTYRYIHFFIFS